MTSTKDTRHRSTGPRSNGTGSRPTTAAPSAGSTNTFRERHENGARAESIVVEHYEKQGYRVCGRRVRAYFAEIDLVFGLKRDQIKFMEPGWILCEVKFQRRERQGVSPVSPGQQSRLRRAFQAFVAKNGEAEFHLALVDEDGKVETIRDFL